MRPPTATAIAITHLIVPSARPARCLPPAPQMPRRSAPSPVTCQRRPRAHRCPSTDPEGQGDLQAAKGNHRTILCRRQAASRTSLRALSRSHTRAHSVPAGRRRPEHQENRNGHGAKANCKARIGRPPQQNSPQQRLRVRKPTKQNPAKKMTGFVSSLSFAQSWAKLYGHS